MNEQIIHPSESVEKEVLISKNDFIILNFFTFNLYSIWWTYKSWRFFKEKEKLDIEPVMRAIFSIFFLFSLFQKIKHFAVINGYPASYSSILLYLGVILFGLSSYLPFPFFIVTFLSFTCYVPSVEALNQGIANSCECEFQNGFNIRQKVLLIIGSIIWILVLVGIMLQ